MHLNTHHLMHSSLMQCDVMFVTPGSHDWAFCLAKVNVAGPVVLLLLWSLLLHTRTRVAVVSPVVHKEQ